MGGGSWGYLEVKGTALFVHLFDVLFLCLMFCYSYCPTGQQEAGKRGTVQAGLGGVIQLLDDLPKSRLYSRLKFQCVS